MGVRSVLHGAWFLTAALFLGLSGCGGGGGGNPNNSDEGPSSDGQPTKTTANGIHEACALFGGSDETQVNLTSDPAGAPEIDASTNYRVITAGSPAGWTGFFNLASSGGDVVFSLDTSVVTLDVP